MTTAANDRRNDITAAAGQTAFSYTFEIALVGDLVVEKNDVILTITTDYTVTGVGDENGGTVTLVVAASLDDRIAIYSDEDASRAADYATSGDYKASVVNAEFDKVMRLIGDLQSLYLRTLRLATGDTTAAADIVIPSVASRASKYLAFDANGRLVPTSGTANAFVVTTFMETLLDDVDATAAKATLGLGPTVVMLDNLTATTFPGVGDDSADGYAVGSRWLHTTFNALYVCVDASVGAAVWKLANSFALEELADITGGATYTVSNVPAGARAIDCDFESLSVSAAGTLRLYLGDDGGVETSGYAGGYTEDNTSSGFFTNGFVLGFPAATADLLHGSFRLRFMGLTGGLQTWSCSGVAHAQGGVTPESWIFSGRVTINTGGAGELTQIQIAPSTGTIDGGQMTTRLLA